MADRLHQTGQFLDWLVDGLLKDGVKFLSGTHGEDTHAKAVDLLEHALKYCKVGSKTKADAIGSPVLWAILLAQQAHALQHGWEVTDHPEHWGVRAMHALLRERQDQHVTQEGGSRAPRDTRTVPRGLRTAQQVRDIPHPPPPRPHPLSRHPCAQLADRSSEDARMRPLRVDELGRDDDTIKAKVGRGAAWLADP